MSKKEMKYRTNIKRIKLKPKQFTVKVQLKNIIKRIDKDRKEKPTYSFDLYINDVLASEDRYVYNVKDINELFIKVVKELRM